MASINELLGKIKGFWTAEEAKRDKILTIAIIFLVGTASFGLGRLSAWDAQKEPVKVEMGEFSADVNQVVDSLNGENEPQSEIELKEGGFVVGSKTSDKYHYPWCSGAKRIKEENKIYFASIEEARAAGYFPAGNCKGLK